MNGARNKKVSLVQTGARKVTWCAVDYPCEILNLCAATELSYQSAFLPSSSSQRYTNMINWLNLLFIHFQTCACCGWSFHCFGSTLHQVFPSNRDTSKISGTSSALIFINQLWVPRTLNFITFVLDAEVFMSSIQYFTFLGNKKTIKTLKSISLHDHTKSRMQTDSEGGTQHCLLHIKKWVVKEHYLLLNKLSIFLLLFWGIFHTYLCIFMGCVRGICHTGRHRQVGRVTKETAGSNKG